MESSGDKRRVWISASLAWICVLTWLIPYVGIHKACRKETPLAPPSFSVPEGSERVCLSLRVLRAVVSSALADGSPIPEECRTLAGIGLLEGYVIQYGEEEDVILVGLRSGSRPSLRLDDLIVNMRCARQPLNHPYCSLDPLPEHTRALQALLAGSKGTGSLSGGGDFIGRLEAAVGPQEVVIEGVPRNSRHAHVMVDADYHMKKVCQGHVSLPGVTSYLDRSLRAAEGSLVIAADPDASAMRMARFWFDVASDCPTFQESKGAVWIAGCRVVVRTEKQHATPAGELYDAAEDDPLGTAFAGDLSQTFDSATEMVPPYADLENLYRLRALLLAMRLRGSLSAIGSHFGSYLSAYRFEDEKPMDPTLPGLVNWKAANGTCSFVCGGVGMNMTVDADSFSHASRNSLFAFRQAVLDARPSEAALWWTAKGSPSDSEPVPERRGAGNSPPAPQQEA